MTAACRRWRATRTWYHAPCPACGGTGAARPTSPTPSSTRPGTSCATRRPAGTTGRSIAAAPQGGCRSPPTSAATSTRCSTCSTAASSPWRCTTSATSPSRSRSPGSAPTALIVKDGAKMSKSQRQRRHPRPVHRAWGADTFRMYLMFLGPLPGRRRFPGRRDQRAPPVPRQGLALVGEAADGASPRGRAGEERSALGRAHGQVAPRQDARHRRDGGAALQHGHRGGDGTAERVREEGCHRPDAGGGDWC